MSTQYALKYLNDLWDARKAEALSPAETLVYRSNLLGSDRRITNTGGGNTSSKLTERDPQCDAPLLSGRAGPDCRVRRRY
jgi:hypothetical protein